ncbi:MAG: PxKF domain-containing protein, partial [Actinobacteria bacterium]|nr:PxKF domain-containing protein [Actinomycetota bacterium]
CTTGAAATGLKIDTVAPAIVCPTVPTFVLGDAATLTATVDDATSGPVAATLSASADTSGVGTRSLSFATSDLAGNTSTVFCAYNVVYRFAGFFSPQSNTALNDQKAGGSTPVKFSLSGNKGLGVIAALSTSQVDCGTRAPAGTVSATAAAISYDAASDAYMLKWKTDAAWSGTCRLFDVLLNDGTHHALAFRFR